MLQRHTGWFQEYAPIKCSLQSGVLDRRVAFIPFGMREWDGEERRADSLDRPKKDNRLPAPDWRREEIALSLRDNFSKGRIGRHGRLQSSQHGHWRLLTGCDESGVFFLS
jgi:hypothetical protein